jgi:hypothetical protein
MNSFRQASSLLLAAVCSMQLSQAAFAQATVLTGQVDASGGSPQLLQRQAEFDTTPTAPPTTYVNPNLHANLRSNANARGSASANASANQNFHPQRPIIHTVYVQDNRTFFQRHPMVKSATIGAGVGAGAGALTGLVTGRGVIRGALIGGGAGAGVGVVRSSQIMKRHPIVRDVATGSLVGLGLGAAASRGHRLPLQATAVGAAVGLGVGLFKNLR